MSRLFVGLIAAAGLAGPAAAQSPPPPAPAALSGSAVVYELEVVKRLPGPRIWKAAKPDSDLFIVGAVTPIPHLQAWDTSRTENAIDNAVVVLLPPEGKVGMFDLVGLAVTGGGAKLSGGRTLPGMLSPETKARFERLMKLARQGWKRYDRLKPGLAGAQLIADFRKAGGLSDAKPGVTIEKLAKQHGTPSRAVAEYRLRPLLKTLTDLPDSTHLACLNDALDEVEYEEVHSVPAAKAWAEGDLAGVRAHYRPNRMERCLQAAPSVNAMLEKATADTTLELKKVLDRPGKTVAVVDLALLLRANGVLDRLKADGAQISVPEK